jgi:small subunit ribosomal protein S2
MNRLPDALVVIDPKREHIAVKEAARMGVATVALIDTDSDPDEVDLPIPGNDDSIRSIELIFSKLADAVLEGKAALPPEPPSGPQARPAPVGPRPAPVGGGNGNSPTPANQKPASAVVE